MCICVYLYVCVSGCQVWAGTCGVCQSYGSIAVIRHDQSNLEKKALNLGLMLQWVVEAMIIMVG